MLDATSRRGRRKRADVAGWQLQGMQFPGVRRRGAWREVGWIAARVIAEADFDLIERMGEALAVGLDQGLLPSPAAKKGGELLLGSQCGKRLAFGRREVLLRKQR